MVNCKHCGGVGTQTTVLPTFVASGLGAPFKVVLDHAVKVERCGKCGEVSGTYIPDMEGLFHTVVFARALEPRKLTGAELKFMRKAMGWKAKELVKHLDITAEHLSRCEAGARPMSMATEKLFRLYTLLKTPDRSALKEIDLSTIFDHIVIESTWDPAEELEFRFIRRQSEFQMPLMQTKTSSNDNNDKWRPEKLGAPAKVA